MLEKLSLFACLHSCPAFYNFQSDLSKVHKSDTMLTQYTTYGYPNCCSGPSPPPNHFSPPLPLLCTKAILKPLQFNQWVSRSLCLSRCKNLYLKLPFLLACTHPSKLKSRCHLFWKAFVNFCSSSPHPFQLLPPYMALPHTYISYCLTPLPTPTHVPTPWPPIPSIQTVKIKGHGVRDIFNRAF